jgi:heme exporter protein A
VTDPVTTTLVAENISKRFGLRTIFARLNFVLQTGDILAITGRNGSGKSTLLKILANVTELTEGTLSHQIDGRNIKQEELPRHLGFVSPYLQLYTEFTAWEQLELVQKLRGLTLDEEYGQELFEWFNIADRRHDVLRTFSSGMLQRVKYICALIHRPTFLLLDEPRTNLDRSGIDAVYQIIEEGSASRLTIIATNDPEDLEHCNATLSVDNMMPAQQHA